MVNSSFIILFGFRLLDSAGHLLYLADQLGVHQINNQILQK